MSVETILTGILQREGWPQVTNRPADKGGLTKGGIVFTEYNLWRKQQGERELLPTEFPALSEEDARRFLLSAIAGPLLAVSAVDQSLFELLFDWATTSGPSPATRALQSELRALGYTLTVDGVYGSQTDVAVKAAAGKGQLAAVRHSIAVNRVDWYLTAGLRDPAVVTFRAANPTTDLENVRGWVLRALAFT